MDLLLNSANPDQFDSLVLLQSKTHNNAQLFWFCFRGIEHSTLFYDMPLCMNGELCLGMIKDILYAVNSFAIITFRITHFIRLQIVHPLVALWPHG